MKTLKVYVLHFIGREVGGEFLSVNVRSIQEKGKQSWGKKNASRGPN